MNFILSSAYLLHPYVIKLNDNMFSVDDIEIKVLEVTKANKYSLETS